MLQQTPVPEAFPSIASLKSLKRTKLREGDRPTQDQKSLQIKVIWQNEVIRVEHFTQPQIVTLGSNKHADIQVAIEQLDTEIFNLLTPTPAGLQLHWAPWMHAVLIQDDGTLTTSYEMGHGATELGLHDRILLQAGPVYLQIQYVRPARLLKSFWKSSVDTYFSKVLTFSIVFHAFLIAALMLTPLNPFGMEEDFHKTPNRFALLGETEAEIIDIEIDWTHILPQPSPAGGQRNEEEGKFGKAQAKQEAAASSQSGAPVVNPDTQENDRKIVSASGIFGVLQGMKQVESSSVFGPGGVGQGINDALGGIGGLNHGDTTGAGGLGTRGTKPGGGGQSLGIGGFGNGPGIGPGGDESISISVGGKKKIQVTAQRMELKGCLKPETVRRVLGRYTSQARYCYEKELPGNPNLAGKVTTSFVIGPTGSVIQASIQESTLQSRAVESCLIRSLQRMKFPACQGGGNAYVTYPWIFKSGGD